MGAIPLDAECFTENTIWVECPPQIAFGMNLAADCWPEEACEPSSGFPSSTEFPA